MGVEVRYEALELLRIVEQAFRPFEPGGKAKNSEGRLSPSAAVLVRNTMAPTLGRTCVAALVAAFRNRMRTSSYTKALTHGVRGR
jgi:hypothetical protein